MAHLVLVYFPLRQVMVPQQYQTFISTLTDVVTDEAVSMDRIDEAVGRILTAKFHLGLFEQPGADPNVDMSVVGSPAHRAVAREAVAKSLVLLKNENSVLPIDVSAATKTIVVAGRSRNDMGNQCGG